MKDLLKVAVVMALLFASTFLLIQGTGLITQDGVRALLVDANSIHPGWFILLIIGLLLLDLFIAVPTMTTILLAGFLLGPLLGGAAAAAGLMLLGITGYGLGRRFGRPILGRLFKDERRLADIEYRLCPQRPVGAFCLSGAAHPSRTQLHIGWHRADTTAAFCFRLCRRGRTLCLHYRLGGFGQHAR